MRFLDLRRANVPATFIISLFCGRCRPGEKKMNFPAMVKKVRTSLNETQEEFGRRFGTKANTVTRWESGQYQVTPQVIAFCLSHIGPSSQALVNFFWRLMRDHMTPEEVGELVGQVLRDEAKGLGPAHAEQPLVALARKLTAQLTYEVAEQGIQQKAGAPVREG